MNVLFVGDINVDIMMGGLETFPVPDREVFCSSFEMVMGSSAVISACAYAALGGSTAFLGLAGNDEYGEFMLNGLRERGIDLSQVRRSDAVKTGVTVNLIHGRQRTQVTFPGSIAAFDGADVQADVFRGIQHVHFAGPYCQTKFRPELTRLLSMARQAGLTTSLDPQWDPSGTWAHMDEWLGLLTYFFPNRDEAQAITGADSAAEACLRLAQRTACPVLKDGKHGALLVVDGKTVTFPAPVVRVVDTTGAGDTFDAAFLYATLVMRQTPAQAANFANAAAARSCTFVGGTGARSTCADVLKLMKEPA